jgi:ABC-type uncharacterized transport system permease subunit
MTTMRRLGTVFWKLSYKKTLLVGVVVVLLYSGFIGLLTPWLGQMHITGLFIFSLYFSAFSTFANLLAVGLNSKGLTGVAMGLSLVSGLMFLPYSGYLLIHILILLKALIQWPKDEHSLGSFYEG